MLAFIVALTIPAAGIGALTAIAVTVRAQVPALRRLLADSHSLQRDREFLAVLIATPAATTAARADEPVFVMAGAPTGEHTGAVARARVVTRPAARRAMPLWPAHLRAAA